MTSNIPAQNAIKTTKKSFLFLNIPHSGRNYLNLFKNRSNLSMNELRKSEDTYIDLLLDNNILRTLFTKIIPP